MILLNYNKKNIADKSKSSCSIVRYTYIIYLWHHTLEMHILYDLFSYDKMRPMLYAAKEIFAYVNSAMFKENHNKKHNIFLIL